MIEIKNVSYTINNYKILDDINSVFHAGEIAGIIGESGCGKTILLKIIAGLIKNYSGEILFNNQLIKSIHPKDIQRHIAYLFSASYDIIDDTVFNFLLQSRKLHKKILNPFTDFDIEITEEYIKQFLLSGYRDKKILSLPDGILKRVFLAFPFIKKAELLILDNPTTNLDLHSTELLQKAILRYVINGDKTIIIAGNDLNFILQTADRIIIMKEGKVDAELIPERLDSEIIEKYFNAEVLLSRNIYNGKPIVHQFLKGEG